MFFKIYQYNIPKNKKMIYKYCFREQKQRYFRVFFDFFHRQRTQNFLWPIQQFLIKNEHYFNYLVLLK